MATRKVLFVCHNHPALRPAGAEAYAYELHQAFREWPGWEPTFLARCGPPQSRAPWPHAETRISPVDGRRDEYFLHTGGYDFDWLFQTMRRDKELFTRHLRRFLRSLAPDVVHVQHTISIGLDLLREIRVTLPDVPIVYTLHEFLPICHNRGQLLRTTDGTPCRDAAPRRCSECFPSISPPTFFLRRRFIQAQLALVDRFVAPSAFLRDRYVDWGVAAERILVEDYGRRWAPAPAAAPRERRDRLGFFGQLSPFKGVDVLLEAMRRLDHGDGAPAHLTVHGTNLDTQDRPFRERFERLLEDTRGCVTFAGAYAHDRLSDLMGAVDWVVVPSIWWENSPLVIQEAFLHGRPVICSDIGGMAEKVADGVGGLHFRAGDAASLAETLERAVRSPGLWEELRAGIPPVRAMSDHVPVLVDLYDRLLAERAPAPEVAVR